MKRIFNILLMICILFSSAAMAEDTRPPLRLGGAVAQTDYWQEHGIKTTMPHYGWDDYMTIVKSDNAPDLYNFYTRSDDFLVPKNAGLLADLSGSEIIRAWTDRLRPDIKKLVTTEDGKIVGLAGLDGIVIFLPVYWRQDAWDAAGLTKEDVPKSYTELLDFLEKWMERIGEKPEKSICVADTLHFGKGAKNRYVRWLLDILINTWEMQQYYAGETLNFNTPEFIALLKRTQDIGLRLSEAESIEENRQNMLQLFENYSGGDRYNAGRDYGLSHTVPFRITRGQPELMRGSASISVVRADSQWLNEIIGRMENDLADRGLNGGGNADLLTDVKPRTYNPKEVYSPSTVTAGYLKDLDQYTGIVCFAPMQTFTMYEDALVKFWTGQLPAENFAAQISQPKRDPNK
jgi:hypothetical protein